MPTYVIEQFELHTQLYRIEAANEAEAITKLLNGEADAVDGGLEYIEVASDFGMPVDEERDLAVALRSLDVAVGDDVIPSIRSVQQID